MISQKPLESEKNCLTRDPYRRGPPATTARPVSPRLVAISCHQDCSRASVERISGKWAGGDSGPVLKGSFLSARKRKGGAHDNPNTQLSAAGSFHPMPAVQLQAGETLPRWTRLHCFHSPRTLSRPALPDQERLQQSHSVHAALRISFRDSSMFSAPFCCMMVRAVSAMSSACKFAITSVRRRFNSSR